MKKLILIAAAFTLISNIAFAATDSLVSPQTIADQKKMTKVYRLKNHIPVVYRYIPDSDIIQIHVSFKNGIRDLENGKKMANQLLFETIPLSADDFPKDQVFKLTEKYALQLDCGGGIEVSTCALGTVNDYWVKGLELFAALVKEPSLNKSDIELTKQQLTASVKGQMQSPQSMANEMANNLFYPPTHPYYQTFAGNIAEIPTIDRKMLMDIHSELLNASIMTITVVTSMPADAIIASLEKKFGDIPSKKRERIPVAPPKYVKNPYVSVEDQKNPTAYIQIKFNAKSANDKDAVAARLMFSLLDEELGDEVRTKRSLSYSVFSYTLQYDVGIGSISASTSKPKETLEAIAEVINKLKSRDYTRRELDEYKHAYATNYFLTLEEHSSLASALATTLAYHDTTDVLYDFPAVLDKVSPRDIKNLANELLVNFRIGVVYDRAKFQDKWAAAFIKAIRNRGKK